MIPDIGEAGTLPMRKERGSELSWAVPVDDERVTALSIVAWPLEDGAPKKDWRPGTRTVSVRSQWPSTSAVSLRKETCRSG